MDRIFKGLEKKNNECVSYDGQGVGVGGKVQRHVVISGFRR